MMSRLSSFLALGLALLLAVALFGCSGGNSGSSSSKKQSGQVRAVTVSDNGRVATMEVAFTISEDGDPFAGVDANDIRFSVAKLGLAASPRSWQSYINVKETKEAYEVLADLPGLDKKDINISLHENVLTLKGERKYETEKEDENHHYHERTYGNFCRSFRLPQKVAEKDIKAEYKNGVLRITLHKSDEAKPRAIEIN